jgi:regulator of replication initiation timing
LEEVLVRIEEEKERRRVWGFREKEEKTLSPKPGERKDKRNEIFWDQFHLNTPFGCNYHYALALNVFIRPWYLTRVCLSFRNKHFHHTYFP